MPKFKTSNGWLTAYALACGYIETIDHPTINMSLCDNGGGLYDVKAYDCEAHKRLFWESFETIKEARTFFSRKVREFQTQRTQIRG